jgi:murein DD-endopeptidase MepM/ murein hydrolase activator NlpD
MRYVVVLLLIGMLAACGGDGGDGDDTPAGPAAIVDPTPGVTNTQMPLFVRPFANEFPVLNYFDHDVPTAPEVTNRYQLNWRGDRAVPGRDIGGYDGHRGIDWLLPENTPMFAVTAAEVLFAGEITAPCFLEDNKVLTGLTVTLQFVGPDGDTYAVSYSHMNRVDVAAGDLVGEGQQIGLSGVTGCVGRGHLPHVHFQVQRVVTGTPLGTNVIDPYGWEGPGLDPWSVNAPVKRSTWLWKQGQAPDMVPRRPPF